MTTRGVQGGADELATLTLLREHRATWIAHANRTCQSTAGYEQRGNTKAEVEGFQRSFVGGGSYSTSLNRR